jgi:hypothetical protein
MQIYDSITYCWLTTYTQINVTVFTVMALNVIAFANDNDSRSRLLCR